MAEIIRDYTTCQWSGTEDCGSLPSSLQALAGRCLRDVITDGPDCQALDVEEQPQRRQVE